MHLNLSLQHRLSPRHADRLVRLYQAEWWAVGRTKADVEAMLAGPSLPFAYIDENDELAAFARVLSDGVFKAFVFDVIVRPDLRGKGLGHRILDDIRRHPAIVGVKHLELYCKPELREFYSGHGFSADTGGIVLMRSTGRG